MLKGITFDKQLCTSINFAEQVNYVFKNAIGIMDGCVTTNTTNYVNVADGNFMVYGRHLQVAGGVSIQVPTVTNNTYTIFVCEIDLSKSNTTIEFNQGYFKFVTSTSGYPSLTQQNLNEKPIDGIYQIEFARFLNTSSGITNFIDTHQKLSLERFQEIDILATDWGLVTGGFSAIKTLSGFSTNDHPTVSPTPAGNFLTSDESISFSYVQSARITNTNQITFFATQKPLINIKYQIKGV